MDNYAIHNLQAFELQGKVVYVAPFKHKAIRGGLQRKRAHVKPLKGQSLKHNRNICHVK